MKQYIIITIAMLGVEIGFAHQSHNLSLETIHSAELTFGNGETIVLRKNQTSLISLALKTDYGLVPVKVEDLIGIDNPQMDSIVMTWNRIPSGDFAGETLKIIHISFGSDKQFGKYPIAFFYFFGSKYAFRETREWTYQEYLRDDLYKNVKKE